MHRHSPNRHQKSKGRRLKHVLQIGVLVAVCFWLIYQVKHSHDKRKQFDENDAKTSRDVEMNNALLKLGRKGLNPQEKGLNKDLESHDEEAEEEIVEEDKNEEEIREQDKNEEEIGEEDKREEEIEEEDKHEGESEEEDKHEEETGEEDKTEEETGEEDKHEEETGDEDKHEEETGEEDKLEEETGVEDKHEKEDQEEDIESEEKVDEGIRGGDDGVNEQEQEKTDSSNNQEEELIEEEKDKKETDEKETEDKYDNDSQQKNDSSIEDHDHDEGSKNTREAREEQYKGDDASSAVTHDGRITSTENVVGNMENENSTDVNMRELEAAGNVNSVSQGNSTLTPIVTLESNVQSETINNTDPQDSSIRNETEIIMSDLSHSHSVTDGNVTAAEGANVETLVVEKPDNSTVAVKNTILDSNSTSATATKNLEENPEEFRDSSTNSENKDGSESTTTVESTDAVEIENAENVEGADGTYEKSDSFNTEDTDEVQHDSIDSSDLSVPVDDKENHIDLDTLPDIRTEGSNSEEVAEE